MRKAIWAGVIACVPIYAEPAAAAVTFIEGSVETGIRTTVGASQSAQTSTDEDHSTTQRELNSRAAVAETRSSNGYVDRINHSLSGNVKFAPTYAAFKFEHDALVDLKNPLTPGGTSDESAFGSYTFGLDGTTHLDLNYYNSFSFSSRNATYTRTNAYAEIVSLSNSGSLPIIINLNDCRSGCRTSLFAGTYRASVWDSALHLEVGNLGAYGGKYSNYITLQFQTGVPEPSLWLSLIVGFGMIGGTMRGKRLTCRQCL